MANLKIIRDRIKSVKSIQKVTKAMKMVAAAKMKKSQERMEQARPYSKNLSEMIAHLLSDVASSSFPLLSNRPVKRKAYVVVAADRGLAGAFNTNLLKKAESEINKFGKENVLIFTYDEKICSNRYSDFLGHFDRNSNWKLWSISHKNLIQDLII